MKKMRFSKKIALLVAMVMILSVAWIMPTLAAPGLVKAGSLGGTPVYGTATDITGNGVTVTLDDNGTVTGANGTLEIYYSKAGGPEILAGGTATLSNGVFTISGTLVTTAATDPFDTTYDFRAQYTKGISDPAAVFDGMSIPLDIIRVQKATPVFAATQTSTNYYEDTLADVTYNVTPSGISGTYSWDLPSSTPLAVGTTSYTVNFTSTDLNYNNTTFNVSVTTAVYPVTNGDITGWANLIATDPVDMTYDWNAGMTYDDIVAVYSVPFSYLDIAYDGTLGTPIYPGLNQAVPVVINASADPNYDFSGVTNLPYSVNGIANITMPIEVSALSIDTSNGPIDQGTYYDVPFNTAMNVTADIDADFTGLPTPDGIIEFTVYDSSLNVIDFKMVNIDTTTATATATFNAAWTAGSGYTIDAKYVTGSSDDPYVEGSASPIVDFNIIAADFTDYPDVAAVPYGWTLDKAVRFTASNPLDLDNSTFSLFQEPDAATVGTLVWDTPDLEPLYDPMVTSFSACPTYLMGFIPANANYNTGTDNVPVLTLAPMFEGLGYDGVVDLKVGESYVFIPTKDDQVGGNGWALSNAAVGNLTFNSPATFHATAVGTTKITFTTAEGYVIEATINVTAAGASSMSGGSSTGDNTPLFLIIGAGILALIAAGVVTVKKVKATK